MRKKEKGKFATERGKVFLKRGSAKRKEGGPYSWAESEGPRGGKWGGGGCDWKGLTSGLKGNPGRGGEKRKREKGTHLRQFETIE